MREIVFFLFFSIPGFFSSSSSFSSSCLSSLSLTLFPLASLSRLHLQCRATSPTRTTPSAPLRGSSSCSSSSSGWAPRPPRSFPRSDEKEISFHFFFSACAQHFFLKQNSFLFGSAAAAWFFSRGSQREREKDEQRQQQTKQQQH